VHLNGQMATTCYSLKYVCKYIGLSPKTVRKYVSEGLVEVCSQSSNEILFDEKALERLQKIRRLREDLGINLAGIDVILRLLKRIEDLQEEIYRLGGDAKQHVLK